MVSKPGTESCLLNQKRRGALSWISLHHPLLLIINPSGISSFSANILEWVEKKIDRHKKRDSKSVKKEIDRQ